MTAYGILIFEQAEELDFVGAWEVFTTSAAVRAGESSGTDTVVTIAEPTNHIHCHRGLQVIPHHTIDPSAMRLRHIRAGRRSCMLSP